MKLKFKTQAHQTAAVSSVMNCLKGQMPVSLEAKRYRITPGVIQKGQNYRHESTYEGFQNPKLHISQTSLLENIRAVQHAQNLPLSCEVVQTDIAPLNLDIEMETGTGKTYCYLKTMFEMHAAYGFSKFIIVVPSIAIREGVAKSLDMTSDHFFEHYKKKARFFIYNSKQLHQLESFSSDAGICVMIINVQAFNATGKDNRRINEVLDDFQSRKPIDVIAANRPILILDEPQKMEGKATLSSLKAFNALMVLRYSATHKTTHNKIHRLDALDAYYQKLVKKIAVRGISVKGQTGTSAYLYLQSIDISSTTPPVACLEFEQKLKNGTIRRVLRKLQKGDHLFSLSCELDAYREGFLVIGINPHTDTLHFQNGIELTVGDAIGDVTEEMLRRIQIREAIKAHFDKEETLFEKGIKVLSLFFIDEVAKYRNYTEKDEKGAYARIFEEEYQSHLSDVLNAVETPYLSYLKGIAFEKTHKGYFAIDKKTKRLKDPDFKTRGENAGISDDVDAYDLILKDKERLLSFEEPVRFIFSHSALREGWDNPNVFVICALKHSDNTISRRQEVGRGLRLSVNQNGERMDDAPIVHEVNVLTVVTAESYTEFVSALQKDISASLSFRPRVANEAYFIGQILKGDAGEMLITPSLAKQIYRYLLKNDYADEADQITNAYHEAQKEGALATLPPELLPYQYAVFELINRVLSDAQLPSIDDGRKAKTISLNANFDKAEFKALWQRIHKKAVYSVHFDSNELIQKTIKTLNDPNIGLRVTPLQYTVLKGEQKQEVSLRDIESGKAFALPTSQTETYRDTLCSFVSYDLIGKLSSGTRLTRRTIVHILKGIHAAVFAQFKMNPESFIAETVRLINEQKATMIIDHLAYNPIEDSYGLDIFTNAQTCQDLSRAIKTPKHHIYDFVLPDSGSTRERDLAEALEGSSEVVVYAKLPRGFFIPTPVGNYNPDWAIAFQEGAVKHVYFVAETKGSLSSMDLRPIENAKIECARKFFDAMNRRFAPEKVTYDVVTDFSRLIEIVNKT